MAREDVLLVGIAEVNPVALLDDELALSGFGGGVDLDGEGSGRWPGLGGGELERRGVVDLDLDVHFVPVEAGVEVEVDHLGDDPLAGLDPHQFLAGSLDGTAAGPFEIITDRSDHAVVVGRGEVAGQQAVALFATGGDLVEVGHLHGVAGREFEDGIAREFQHVFGRREVLLAAAADGDLADGDRLAAVFEKLEVDEAQLAGREVERPLVRVLLELADGLRGRLGQLGGGREIEVGGREGAHRNGGRLAVLPGAQGFHFRRSRGDDRDEGHRVQAARREQIDGPVAFARREFQTAIDHDGGGPAGDPEAQRAVALLDEGARPDEDEGVRALLGCLPRELVDLEGFVGLDLFC